jgi:predicted nucleotidyltransferase
MSKYQTILGKIKTAIYSIDPLAEVYLFGSRARKTARRQSDWDILILLDSETVNFELEKRFINVLYDIEIETGEVISPLIYTRSEWEQRYLVSPLFENIIQEGVRI